MRGLGHHPRCRGPDKHFGSCPLTAADIEKQPGSTQFTGHCLSEKRRALIHHMIFPNGKEKWVCMSCGSAKVSMIVEEATSVVPPVISAFLLEAKHCHYCGGVFDRAHKHWRPTRDHIIPRALGGPNAEWNYVPAHAKCNTKKKDDWPTCTCIKCQAAIVIFRRNYAKEKA